jgi:hypothetical protein
MLSFGTYPHRLFEPTIKTLRVQQDSPPPERPLSMTPITPSDASPSPETSSRNPTSSTTPQAQVAQNALPDQNKFSVDEKDFLRSHLPAYRAHCDNLDGRGSGPRKLQGVKGSKKDWIYHHVYPEFSQKFSSGSNTQSLKQVRLATCTYYPEFGINHTVF